MGNGGHLEAISSRHRSEVGMTCASCGVDIEHRGRWLCDSCGMRFCVDCSAEHDQESCKSAAMPMRDYQEEAFKAVFHHLGVDPVEGPRQVQAWELKAVSW